MRVLEPVMAVRSLTQRDGSSLVIELGAPREFEDQSGWYCPYRIGGAGTKVKFAGGVDAVQAIQMVMVMVGSDLEKINKLAGRGLTWQGGQELGFPSPDRDPT